MDNVPPGREGERNLRNISILLMGYGGVGKRTLAKAFFNADSEDEPRHRKIASSYDAEWTVRLDTVAGDDIFNREQDIKKFAAFMVVYSIVSGATFRAVDEYLEQIMRVRDAEANELPILLVGNKIDLEEQRLPSTADGKKKAEKYGIPFIETSAKSMINVEDAFVALIRHFEEKEAYDVNWLEDVLLKEASFWTHMKFMLGSRKKQQLLLKEKQAELHQRVRDRRKLGAPPEIEVTPSSFGCDMRTILNDPQFSDVTFKIAEGFAREGEVIYGHTCIIASHFNGILENLTLDIVKDCTIQQETEKEKEKEGNDKKASGRLENKQEEEIKHYVVSVDYDLFYWILEWVYSKKLNNEDIPSNRRDALKQAAVALQAHPLISIIEGRAIEPMKDTESPSTITAHSLVNNDEFSDIKFSLDGKIIYAHKALLVSRSKYFRNMLCGGLKEARVDEIEITEVSLDTFLVLLTYLYTDSVDELLSEKNVMEVFYLAHMYEVDRLVTLCEVVICRSLDKNNCVDVLQLAEQHSRDQLKRVCEYFIRSNFDAVAQTVAFKALPKDSQQEYAKIKQ